MERWVEFQGGQIRWILRGLRGAVQFSILHGWIVDNHRGYPSLSSMMPPMPCDLGYHSPKPRYEGQTCIDEHCKILNGQPCYYDGSSLNADPLARMLVQEGDQALWKSLQEYYIKLFGSDEDLSMVDAYNLTCPIKGE